MRKKKGGILRKGESYSFLVHRNILGFRLKPKVFKSWFAAFSYSNSFLGNSSITKMIVKK